MDARPVAELTLEKEPELLLGAAPDADDDVVGATLVEQFGSAAEKLVTALRAAGGEPDQLVSLVVYTTDIEAYRAATRELGEVWRRHFGKRYPAMALIGVSSLFEPDAQVELMGVAVLDG